MCLSLPAGLQGEKIVDLREEILQNRMVRKLLETPPPF